MCPYMWKEKSKEKIALEVSYIHLRTDGKNHQSTYLVKVTGNFRTGSNDSQKNLSLRIKISIFLGLMMIYVVFTNNTNLIYSRKTTAFL